MANVKGPLIKNFWTNPPIIGDQSHSCWGLKRGGWKKKN
jgi:hypothetical protein